MPPYHRGLPRSTHSFLTRRAAVLAAPLVQESEWRAFLASIEDLDCDYLVASGSLPRGAPEDLYATVADMARRKGAKLVLDTSGMALRAGITRGVYLLKPRSEEPTSELQSLMRISYAVFCLH